MRPSGRAPVPEPLAPDASGDDLIELGRIVARHGIRGEVRLLPHNPDSTIFATLTHLVLARDRKVERRRLSSVRPHKHVLLAQFEGVDTADAAEALVGSVVSAPREALPNLAPAEVYYVELIGCPVVTDAGVPLGSVTRVFSNGSNDICEVRDETREHLIPLIEDIVVRLQVTPPDRILVIRPIPGLLDDE
jgi:16S rRNA processing protein RimM